MLIVFALKASLIFNLIISSAQDDKSFLLPPELITNPSSTENYSAESRRFAGISSLAVSPGGRLWATWYVGITPGEDHNNYVVVGTSCDQGETWEEVLAIDPDGSGPVRAFDPDIWIDPDGQMWVFWAQHISHKRATRAGVWALNTNDPDNANPSWEEPRRLIDGVMMCKPVVLSSGVWVLPVSLWHVWEESAKMVVSMDRGKTWKVRGSVNVPGNVRNHDEHMIVERKDGSLWMLVRTRGAGYGIGESISKDRGQTWSPLIPSRIQHPNARFFIYRLHSGNLLLVKHGPIDMRITRSHLMAFISRDDGHSWSNGLLLDADSTVKSVCGHQEGAEKGFNMTKKGAKIYHPLLVFVSEMKLLCHFWFRSGSAYTSNAIVECLKEVQGSLPRDIRKVFFRADSGFFSGEILIS